MNSLEFVGHCLAARKFRKLMNQGSLKARFSFEYVRGEILLDLVKKKVTLKGKRVLDVGCGCGGMSEVFRRADAEVIGIDICKEQLEFGQKKSKKENFCLARAERLPFPEKSFEIVIAASMIDHLEPKAQRLFVREAWRVLEPGGYLIITFNPANSFLKKVLKIDAGEKPERAITEEGISRLLQDSFKTEQVWPFWERPLWLYRWLSVKKIPALSVVYLTTKTA